MATDIKAPQFPESVADGTVATWHKQEGEAVKRDELLVDIETDKVVLEVVAPADGVVSKILAGEGDTVVLRRPVTRPIRHRRKKRKRNRQNHRRKPVSLPVMMTARRTRRVRLPAS